MSIVDDDYFPQCQHQQQLRIVEITNNSFQAFWYNDIYEHTFNFIVFKTQNLLSIKS